MNPSDMNNDLSPQDGATTDTGTAGGDDLQTRLAQAEQKAGEHWELYLRARADLENQQRRMARELENAHKYGLERFVNELLPVKDSLQEALKAAAMDGLDAATALEKIIEGTRMTLGILDKTLTKVGLSEVHPAGEPFNPELHQAMALADSADLPSNHVVQVVQTGYRLHDRLVRPAMVIVSK
jgi:molecular chaperone GrpE